MMDARAIKWDDEPAGIVWDEPTAKPAATGERFNPMNPGKGVAEAVLSLGSGAIATPFAGLAGIAGAALPGPQGQGADWVRKTQDALTYQPRTAVGQGITSAVAYPFEKLAEGADWAGSKVADQYGPVAGTAANTAIQSLPMLVSPALRKIAPGGELPSTLAKRQAAQVAGAQTDEAVAAARAAGLAVPPSQANPSFLNRSIEGAAGKIKTAQALSEQNQPKLNQLVRENFGLPADAPLTPETLGQVRKVAGTMYENVRSAGRIVPEAAYFQALDNIAAPYRKAATDFPKAAKRDVIKAVESVRVPSFDAGSAVDQIRIMRDNADAAYRSGDKAMGRAYKGIADNLENALDQHIAASGVLPPESVEAFRNARRMIAQTYTVEKHLRPSGNVDAQGLAGELKRKPLTANLRMVAEFGANFRKAAQVPEKIGGVPMSPLDYMVSLGSLGGAVASGQPSVALGAIAPFARPGLRKMIGSDWYQNAMTGPRNYGPSLSSGLLALQEQPGIGLLETALAQRQQ